MTGVTTEQMSDAAAELRAAIAAYDIAIASLLILRDNIAEALALVEQTL